MKDKRTFPITLKDGTGLTFELDSPRGDARDFIFALHKSGSVLLNKMLQSMADAVGASIIDLPGYLFHKGVNMAELSGGTGAILDCKGYVFGGFRNYPPPTLQLRSIAGCRVVVLVRDPRDILVSLYYSTLRSHAVPRQGTMRKILLGRRKETAEKTVDQFVLEDAGKIRQRFTVYSEKVLADPTVDHRIFRYEDVIFEKLRWITEIAEFLEWDVPQETLQQIASENDIRPEAENIDQHIRRVTPGDHREKLQPETIAELNDIFRPVVAEFGYQL